MFRRGLIPDLSERWVVDVPCGSGVVSYWLRRAFPDLQLRLYDIDPANVTIAQKHFGGSNVGRADLYSLNLPQANNVWLLINSLYCLPEVHTLVRTMSRQMEYVFGVFPHLGTKNIRAYLAEPGAVDPNLMSQAATVGLFGENGYEVLYQKDITRIAYLSSRVRKWPWGFWWRKTFNLTDRFAILTGPYYWLALFRRMPKY